jgi:acetoacetate decarboxylase
VTNREQLEDLLPEGFVVGAEPIVTVSFNVMTEIEWLAGRGYNTLGVSFPAVFTGERDRAVGNFLTVLWENLADPIITGREELGFSKIYCELPEPRVCQGETHCIAGWMGFKFMDLKIRNLAPAQPSAIPDARTDGTLHFKYMPKTGEWGSADGAHAVLTPAHTPNRVVVERWTGEGTVQFRQAAWEDLPTMFHIVNAFHDLEILEYRGATVTRAVGGKDLSDQRILR